jgi:hypothetical protein
VQRETSQASADRCVQVDAAAAAGVNQGHRRDRPDERRAGPVLPAFRHHHLSGDADFAAGVSHAVVGAGGVLARGQSAAQGECPGTDKESLAVAAKLDAFVRQSPAVEAAFTIVGMLPLALGFGAGSELRIPMAIAIMGGLLTSNVLSLVVVPVV